MGADRDLADQVAAHLKATTISYPDWQRRVAAGRYTPKDGSGTEWGKAFVALGQIDQISPPPPVAKITQTVAQGATVSGTVAWLGKYDATGDGIEDDPGSVRFYVDGTMVLEETNPPFGDTAGFWDSSTVANGTHSLEVRAVDTSGTVIATNTVSVTVNNDSVPDGDVLAWGYRPPVPAGWTLVENKSLTSADVQGVSKKYFRNCDASWIAATPRSSDLIFVDCDCTGGMGKYGDRISFYGCHFGDRSNGDGCQTSGVGSVQSTDFLFQGCTFRNVIRTDGSYHTDGMEVYGLNGLTVRYCYFNNIAVETILVQPNQANQCQNNHILIERNYFGPDRPDAGGCDVKFADAGSTGNVGPCVSRDNYGGSTCLDNYVHTAAYPANTAETHHSRSEWPYKLLRADGWLDY